MEQSVKTITMPVRHPRSGTFELTLRCNLHCKMCMLRHADCENAALMHDELTAEAWIDMARQAAEAGTISLLVTGGEPMLRPDFCEIWEGIYQLGFVITLYTNATLVSPKIMETLRKYPPHRIGITLYGASAETYEKVCGNADAYQHAMDGIAQLHTLPSVMEFRATIIAENRCDVAALDHYVYSNYGQPLILSSELHKPVRGACGDAGTCRLSPAEMDVMQNEHILHLASEYTNTSLTPDAVSLKYQEHRIDSECDVVRYSLFGCNAGMNQYTISCDGKLLGCQLLGIFSTDALNAGFSNAWGQYPAVVHIPQENNCANCDVSMYCRSCFASRIAESGRINGCSDYLYQKSVYNKGKLSNGR